MSLASQWLDLGLPYQLASRFADVDSEAALDLLEAALDRIERDRDELNDLRATVAEQTEALKVVRGQLAAACDTKGPGQ